MNEEILEIEDVVDFEDRSLELEIDETLTVRELIENLNQYPLDTEVSVSHAGIKGVYRIDAVLDNKRFGNDNDEVIINFIIN